MNRDLTADDILKLSDLQIECHPGFTAVDSANTWYATAELKIVITANDTSMTQAIIKAAARIAEVITEAARAND